MKARLLGLSISMVAWGCNSILGIEQRELVPALDASAGTAADAGGTRGANGPVAGEGGISNSAGGTASGGNAGDGAAAGAAGLQSGGSAGSGGGPPEFVLEGELADALSALDGYRYENTCAYVEEPGGCERGSLCYKTPQKPVNGFMQQIAIGGDASHVYEVVLRVRGVLEPHVYPPSCGRIVQPPPNKTIGIVEDCDGAENLDDPFNTFGLKVQTPPHEYFLNAVPRDSSYRVEAVDLTWTTQIRGQSSVSFEFADQVQAGQVRNCTEVVPGVPPAPEIFDGQFLQINVTGAKILP